MASTSGFSFTITCDNGCCCTPQWEASPPSDMYMCNETYTATWTDVKHCKGSQSYTTEMWGTQQVNPADCAPLYPGTGGYWMCLGGCCTECSDLTWMGPGD